MQNKMKLILILAFLASVLAEEPSKTEQQYRKIIAGIEDALVKPHLQVLTEVAPNAGLVPETSSPTLKLDLVVARGFSEALHRLYVKSRDRLKGYLRKTRFENIYKHYVAEPCVEIDELEKKLNTCIEADPQLERDRFRLMIPKLFTSTVELCAFVDENQKRTFKCTYKQFIDKRNGKDHAK